MAALVKATPYYATHAGSAVGESRLGLQCIAVMIMSLAVYACVSEHNENKQ